MSFKDMNKMIEYFSARCDFQERVSKWLFFKGKSYTAIFLGN